MQESLGNSSKVASHAKQTSCFGEETKYIRTNSKKQKRKMKSSLMLWGTLLLVASYCCCFFQPFAECFSLNDGFLRVKSQDLHGWQSLVKNEPSDKYRNITVNIEEESRHLRGGKLIEWDDDAGEPGNTLAELSAARGRDKQYMQEQWAARRPVVRGKNQNLSQWGSKQQSGISRLIYHGQLGESRHKSNSSSVARRETADGLELHIDTHMPVVISRRSFANGWSPSESPKFNSKMSDDNGATTTTTTGRLIAQQQNTSKVQDIYLMTTTTTSSTTESPQEDDVNSRTTTRSWANPVVSQSVPETSLSNWRPIVAALRGSFSSRTRRSDSEKRLKNESKRKQTTESRDTDSADRMEKSLLFSVDYKWKPIVKNHEDNSTSKVLNLSKNKAGSQEAANALQSTVDSYIVSNKRTIGIARLKKVSNIEIPFDKGDDDDMEQEDSGGFNAEDRRTASSAESTFSSASEREREPKLISEQQSSSNNNKWTPLVTLSSVEKISQSALNIPQESLNESSTTAKSSQRSSDSTPASLNLASSVQQGANSSSSEQRPAASDLNYIYSSQPQTQSIAPSSSSYYANYLVPSAPAQPELPLVDTTSGQTPEMIGDRTPIVEQPTQDGYTMPIAVTSFQPAQPPPSRQPYSYSGGGGYEPQQQPAATPPLVASSSTGGLYANAQPFRQQPQQQQVRREQPQMIKQEHHYHYYGSNQAEPQRQAQVASAPPQAQQQQQQQQPTVIRELQPIMISQPMIQQLAAATQAPQTQTIIREIVREVPAQANLQAPARLVQIQAPPPPPPPPPPQPQTIVQLAPPLPQVPTIIRDAFEPQVVNDYKLPAAQRIIRQLSNSLPQVAVRMPPSVAAQFRLQMPGLQLPSIRSNQAPVTRQTGSFIIPPLPKKTTTFMTETQAMPTHTTIMQTTQYTPATRTTVYTTDHQHQLIDVAAPTRAASGYK